MPDHPRIEELRRRFQQDPASIAFAQLAEEHRRAGQYQEAIRICRAGLGRHPDYLSPRVTLARALIELGELDDAQSELEQVLRTAPDNLAAVRALADIHQRRGQPAAVGRWDAVVLDVLELGAYQDPGLGAWHAIDDVLAMRDSIAPASTGPTLEPRNPSPDSAALIQLESWLAAIVADREERRRGRGRL